MRKDPKRNKQKQNKIPIEPIRRETGTIQQRAKKGARKKDGGREKTAARKTLT